MKNILLLVLFVGLAGCEMSYGDYEREIRICRSHGLTALVRGSKAAPDTPQEVTCVDDLGFRFKPSKMEEKKGPTNVQ